MAFCIAGCAWSAHEDYPTGPITLIIPHSAGGGTDLTVRILATGMEKILGQPIVIENVTGGDGVVGVTRMANSRPDGYTLSTGAGSQLVVLPQVMEGLAYDPWTDLSWIGRVGEFAYGLFAPKSKGWETLDDLLESARADSRSLTFGGSGMINLLLVEQIPLALGEKFDWSYMPVEGAGDTVLAMVRGDIDFAAVSVGNVRPFADDFVLLCTLSDERLSDYPDVPAITELGVTEVPLRNFMGIIGPAGLPEEIRFKVEEAMRQAMEDPELMERMIAIFENVSFMNGQDFRDGSYAISLVIKELLEAGVQQY